ncbi:MAG: hypothetical protein ACHQVK_04990, partial [Candidatus Paceibacterales bacterium]
MAKPVKKQLIEVFSNPTAPFREGWVQKYIKSELELLKVAFYQDRWGNIVAGVTGPKKLKLATGIALVAHTDHPGFQIKKKLGPTTFLAKWYGGHPPLMLNASVAIYSPDLIEICQKAEICKKPDKNGFLHIRVANKIAADSVNEKSFGAFNYGAGKFKGDLVYTRTADDLTGVVIILSTLARLKKSERKKIIGIFTTAEEVGFKGALGLLKDGALGPKLSAISLEASRQMPEALIGHGPVIRLGDRKTVFDNS